MSTWDSARHASGQYTFSNRNLTLSKTATTDSSIFSTLSHSSGSFVFSWRITFTGTGAGGEVGFGNATASTANGNYLGIDNNSFGVTAAGLLVISGGSSTITGYTHVSGDQIDIAIDLTGKLFWVRSTSSPNWNGNATFIPGDAHGQSISTLSSFTLSPGVDVTGASGCTVNYATPPTVSSFPVWEATGTTNATYFVDSSIGSDSADGLASTVGGGHGPWQTITKVNSGLYASGDQVLFNSAQTFGPANLGISLGPNNISYSTPPTAASPLTISSYGVSRSTISSGTVSGFSALNISGIIVRDLLFVGGSKTTTTVDGLSIINSGQAGNVQLSYWQFLNLDISLYGRNGLLVYGSGAGTCGFDSVTASNCIIHDNTGGASGPANQNAGMQATAVNAASHSNITVTGCTFHDNTGLAGQSSWTGTGVVLIYTTTGLIANCEAYANGANSASGNGPDGIWAALSTGVVIQFCESHHNHTGGGTQDGGGFDLDGGCVNCTIQYCYSHDNDGYGFLAYAFSGANNTGSTIRYCISQNDGVSAGSQPYGIFVRNDATLTGLSIYNNTIYAGNSGASCLGLSGTNASALGARFDNNILYSATGTNFIDTATTNPSSTHFDGNDYFAAGTFSLKWNSITYSTLASWKAAATQETVNGGFTSNPSLSNPGGGGTVHGYVPASLSAYTLLFGSAMVGVGLDLNSNFSISPGTQDYYGNTIPNGKGTGFNVGAYAGIPTSAVQVDLKVVALEAQARDLTGVGQRTIWWRPN